MKLSYECHLDPAKMPTKQGKKFCDSCHKHVHDLRRKSDEKIALFYQENPSACVIAYEDQLEKLPVRQVESSSRSYFPYAAAVVSIALLPTLAMAQEAIRAGTPLVTIVPISIPDLQAPAATHTQESGTKTFTKYYIKGKVKLDDKKFRTRTGRGITFCVSRYDADGKYAGADTVAAGKVGLTGKFKIRITHDHFQMIKDSHLNVQVKGLGRSRFREMKTEGNVVSGVVHVRRRIRWMGKF
jgi:hypothetical protein